jgi:hypothetical protein
MLKGLNRLWYRWQIPKYVNSEITEKFKSLNLKKLDVHEQSLSKSVNEEDPIPKFVDFYSKDGEANEDNDSIEVNRQQIEHFKFSVPVIDFSDEKMLDLLDIEADLDVGGLSQAAFSFDNEEKALRVIGSIDTERKDKMRKSPFFCLDLRFTSFINFQKANGIRLTMKNKSNSGIGLKLNARTDSVEGVSSVIGYIFENSDEWITLDLPIENLLIEGIDLKKNRFVNPNTIQFKTDQFSFYCESQEDVEFDFTLKKIEIFYDSELESFNQRVRKRPDFFKGLEDYSNAQHIHIETGKNYTGN